MINGRKQRKCDESIEKKYPQAHQHNTTTQYFQIFTFYVYTDIYFQEF